jgi:hypothetical protein
MSQHFSKFPPLEHGDHLARYEFERRYTTVPDTMKAEHRAFVVRLSEKR